MKPVSRFRSILLVSSIALFIQNESAHAATILVSSTFEGSLGAWTTSTGAALYTYSTGTNYASGGTGAANLPKVGGTITLTDALLLNTQAYTSLTITFNFVWLNGASTRNMNVLYASDGTNFMNLGSINTNNGANATVGSSSITMTEGVGHTVSNMTIANGTFDHVFTDTAKFRFTDNASAAADVRVFIDNIVISGSPTYVPEPGSALLGGLGLLALLRRRR